MAKTFDPSEWARNKQEAMERAEKIRNDRKNADFGDPSIGSRDNNDDVGTTKDIIQGTPANKVSQFSPVRDPSPKREEDGWNSNFGQPTFEERDYLMNRGHKDTKRDEISSFGTPPRLPSVDNDDDEGGNNQPKRHRRKRSENTNSRDHDQPSPMRRRDDDDQPPPTSPITSTTSTLYHMDDDNQDVNGGDRLRLVTQSLDLGRENEMINSPSSSHSSSHNLPPSTSTTISSSSSHQQPSNDQNFGNLSLLKSKVRMKRERTQKRRRRRKRSTISNNFNQPSHHHQENGENENENDVMKRSLSAHQHQPPSPLLHLL